jgi:hypothetical protein
MLNETNDLLALRTSLNIITALLPTTLLTLLVLLKHKWVWVRAVVYNLGREVK